LLLAIQFLHDQLFLLLSALEPDQAADLGKLGRISQITSDEAQLSSNGFSHGSRFVAPECGIKLMIFAAMS
jgi:hypothetical protein